MGTILDDDATKFYVVNDGSADRTYEYGAAGTAVENYALNSGNTAPRGAASTAAGTTVWVVDANKNVYVYNTSGGLLGSWTAGSLASNATVEGIATNGTDVWIVDAKQDKVFRYTGAAGRLSGSQNAASSFSLNSSNTNPKDIVTDGVNLWVVDDASTDKVFKYTLSGSLARELDHHRRRLQPDGHHARPDQRRHPLDRRQRDRPGLPVRQRRGACTSGSQSPSTSFALAAGNTNPQGIADPPVPTSGAAQASAFTGIPHPSGHLAAHHRGAFPGASKSTVSSRPSTAVSSSILGPQVTPILIPLTPSTSQDLTLGTAERSHTGTKRTRIALRV